MPGDDGFCSECVRDIIDRDEKELEVVDIVDDLAKTCRWNIGSLQILLTALIVARRI